MLLKELSAHPKAVSAHCDLIEFDLVDDTKPAHHYIGDPLNRMIDFLMTQRGTTLRSLVRKSAFKKPLLFPTIEGDRHWTAFGFHLHLLAAGDSIAVPQSLYKRWQRPGSLTRSAGWQATSTKSIISGQKESINYCLSIFSEYIEDSESLRVAKYALKLFQHLFIRKQQLLIKDYSDIRDEIDPLVELSDEPLHFALISDSNLLNMITNEKKIRQIESELSTYQAS